LDAELEEAVIGEKDVAGLEARDELRIVDLGHRELERGVRVQDDRLEQDAGPDLVAGEIDQDLDPVPESLADRGRIALELARLNVRSIDAKDRRAVVVEALERLR